MNATALPATTRVAIVGAGPDRPRRWRSPWPRPASTSCVLDRLAEGANTSRAAVVHARTLEVLDELGVAGS